MRERACGQWQHREGHVQLGGLDLLEESPVGRVLDELDPHLRPRLGKALQQLGDDARADAREDAETERADRSALELVEIGVGGLRPREDRCAVRQHQASGIGDGHFAGAGLSVDEAGAHEPLERGQLLANGGLAVAELTCRGGKGSLARHGSKGHEVAELDARPPKRFAYI